LATAGADGTAKLWDMATFEEKATWEDLCYVAFSPDDNLRLLAGTGLDGRLLRGTDRDTEHEP
jgi:WD40 repeat protein